MAAQFSLTKGRPQRVLIVWIARAISSLPVPVSPKTRTVESVGATRSTSASTDSRAGLLPIICSNLRALSASAFGATLLKQSTDDPIPRFPLQLETFSCSVRPVHCPAARHHPRAYLETPPHRPSTPACAFFRRPAR